MKPILLGGAVLAGILMLGAAPAMAEHGSGHGSSGSHGYSGGSHGYSGGHSYGSSSQGYYGGGHSYGGYGYSRGYYGGGYTYSDESYCAPSYSPYGDSYYSCPSTVDPYCYIQPRVYRHGYVYGRR